jgi:hypothetical protein
MGELVLFGRAVFLLAVSRVLLARRGTTATLRRLSDRRLRTRPLDPRGALVAVRRAAKIVGGACLPQAVTLASLLQRHGHEPVLILGCLRIPDGTWSAHAWVDLDGDVLEPVTSRTHAALACLDAATGWVPSPIPPTTD